MSRKSRRSRRKSRKTQKSRKTRKSPKSRTSRKRRQSVSRAVLKEYSTKHLSDGSVDWQDVKVNLPSMNDRQKQEILRVAIIYQKIPMIKLMIKQGIKPMKSFYKFIDSTPKGETIRKLLPPKA